MSPRLASFFLAGLLALLALIARNYEFMLYAATVLILVTVIYTTNRYFAYAKTGLWLFNGWLVLHILGGLASYDGVRFYDLLLLDIVGEPYYILKYDQFAHVYCYFAVSILMWSVVQKIARADAGIAIVGIITVLASSSLGAVNEIIEFLAVVLFATQGVGGYTNTALDLVANLLGAITGVLFVLARRRRSDTAAAR